MDYTGRTQQKVEGAGNVCIVVVPGDVVGVVVVAVAGVVEGDAGPVIGGVGEVVVHMDEVQVELSDCIQVQVADSEPLAGSGLTAGLSRPDLDDPGQEPAEAAGGLAHCTRFVEDTGVEKASEEEGKCSGVHTNYTVEHWMEDTSTPSEVADMEGDDHGVNDEEGEVMHREGVLAREQVLGGAGGEVVGVVVEDNVQEVGSDRIHQVGSSPLEAEHSFHIDSGEVEVHT